ncbi:hypothetical protein ACH5RR_009257 [Cinchona calisaya]|uniref:Uncharacterized protein n=1 Tax=Cinchona calisaya TaxID=153742 RepID=A0ABD3AHB3_9GENT
MSFLYGLSYFPGSPGTMYKYSPMFFTCIILSLSCSAVSDSDLWYLHQYVRQADRKFEQKTNRFWEYQEQSNSWVEVELPFNLLSCVNDNCTKVGSIDQRINKTDDKEELDVPELKKSSKKKDSVKASIGGNSNTVLPFRKRVSLTKMSDTSIWITGPSGSIYERFWNGMQWVIAPHDLPVTAGYAISVFIVNQTILALSEAGNLYQLQLNENSQPVWVDFMPMVKYNTSQGTGQSSPPQVISGVSSEDRQKLFFSTKDRSLIELIGTEPPRWQNHGRPPGADVEAIADATSVRPEVVFIISAAGYLYEYDQNSKPAWKKHIQKQESAQDISLASSKGCTFHGLNGPNSVSLFLLTKGGKLVERQFQQRKWKWIPHGSPKDHFLTSITCISQDELNENLSAMFLSTASGFIFEYRIPKQSGTSQENQIPEDWVNHNHPPHAKIAKCITGLQLQVGRMVFPLDDGRISELHLPGIGGQSSGPNHQVNVRRKVSLKYVWSILDAPETEGWNAEYCTEERGPTNCISGMKDEMNEEDQTRITSRRRKGSNAQQNYLLLGPSGSSSTKTSEDFSTADHQITKNFRLRGMHGGKSFFLITDDGLTFEYLTAENVWFWLRHEHSTAIRGAVGNYNGSLFLIDEYGSLFIRERSGNELAWINCTAIKKGRQVIGGPPWDGIPGKAQKATATDALFFVSKSGRLLQLTVALRKFKWKDCRNPPNTKIACIVDQEVLRENIVFVIGRNGRLYQYNKITELWHEHYQSPHLVLSRLPGTAMRPSSLLLKGSLFMLSENGGLVEYQWNLVDGWNWVEHGTPNRSVTLVGSPGPCFEDGQLFLIGSDGNVHLRFLDQTMWKWKNCGFPFVGTEADEDAKHITERHGKEDVCLNENIETSSEKFEEKFQAINKNCDPKVESTRPISFAETSVIFELRDGRLAELKKIGEANWVWSRTIGTPISLCLDNYWTTLAS